MGVLIPWRKYIWREHWPITVANLLLKILHHDEEIYIDWDFVPQRASRGCVYPMETINLE